MVCPSELDVVMFLCSIQWDVEKVITVLLDLTYKTPVFISFSDSSMSVYKLNDKGS